MIFEFLIICPVFDMIKIVLALLEVSLISQPPQKFLNVLLKAAKFSPCDSIFKLINFTLKHKACIQYFLANGLLNICFQYITLDIQKIQDQDLTNMQISTINDDSGFDERLITIDDSDENNYQIDMNLKSYPCQHNQ